MASWALSLHRSLGDFLFVGGVFLVVAEACGAMAVLGATREVRPLLNAWGRGDRSNPRLTSEALSRLDRVPVVYGLAGGVPMLVIAPLLGDAVGLPWSVNAAMGLAAALLVVGSGLLGWAIVDAFLWPVQAELDAVLREDQPVVVRRGVGGRLVMIVFLATLMGSWVAALVTSMARTDAGQYVLAPIVAIPFALGIAIVLSPFGVTPVVRPVEDLAAGTERVTAGIFDQRVPVTSDDEFGQLARSFNRMQAGLHERERLQAAFGSYVDPVLAQRLLERGSELFEGEEAEVTVAFVDVRGFTAYSQGRTPGETVARLNELFSLVVPILRAHGGHANKFLGDGMLAVFGVPEELADHADCAVAAAMAIQDAVHERFGDDLRVGIGLCTGPVIAGTVGGGGKLEFTLVGDTVNVAARIEEMTRSTGDLVLLADSTLEALSRPVGTVSRGEHELRGRVGRTELHALTAW
ncbi:adenylate/guanylate cyclase domain-containing protein [Nocardioides cavernaquae]|uniref:Adenylate/guanylate cyclase domain-containing protein n=2 Tax=Nocardioides cavernaquae TaxID=2321396 RepID=A0A3A5HEF0_9ACTN|nr:adenylate/guanylate cyclase domain-containing protein [Nocardioides cavernaquae]